MFEAGADDGIVDRIIEAGGKLGNARIAHHSLIESKSNQKPVFARYTIVCCTLALGRKLDALDRNTT